MNTNAKYINVIQHGPCVFGSDAQNATNRKKNQRDETGEKSKIRRQHHASTARRRSERESASEKFYVGGENSNNYNSSAALFVHLNVCC